MWDGPDAYNEVSGAFKAALFYSAFDRPLPYASEIYASVMLTIRTDECKDVCWLRNPIELVTLLEPQLSQIPPVDANEIIQISVTNMRRFVQPDGGFSRQAGRSKTTSNGVVLGMGLPEGDMNAGAQMVCVVRPLLYRLANESLPALGTSNIFWQLLADLHTELNTS